MEESQRKPVLMLCTAPPEEAMSIAEELVIQGLVACVNLQDVRSVYLWNGELCRDPELLLIIKTFHDRIQAVFEKIRTLHSYEIPEIIALPIIGGYENYFSWMRDVVR